jgi:hypothetical protein
VRGQDWRPNDEILLVGDGSQPVARSLWDQFHLPGRYLEVPGPFYDWGHTPRNLVMPDARGSHLMALDDDDAMAPGALATVRSVLAANPSRPHMFRMSGDPNVGTVWKVKDVRLGNVGTPMFVVPNEPARLATYQPFHGGDHAFMRDTLTLWSEGSLIWREEIICHVRPTHPR